MVIDKTTGKGCAWSIVSKTIAKKLIADGIVNKIISRRNRESGYDLIQAVDYGDDIYVNPRRGDGVSDEPIWIPSFIQTEVWERAVNSFQVYVSLERNVEKYLLPEMDEYLQSIPDKELVSMTRDFLMEHGVVNTPIRQHKGKTYYFNEAEIFSLDNEAKLFLYEKRLKFNIFRISCETCFNFNVWNKAKSQFKVGMTLKECIGIFLKTELVHGIRQAVSPVDRLVQYIAPPVYERVPGNKDEATFDRVRITVGLPRYQFDSWDALQKEVKKYQCEIYQRVIQRLEKDRQFKRYGTPINFLKISNVTLLRDFSLEFIYELKGR